ncbi:hypothetical protein SADUNF_Sadunf04G0130100 [Salix dunnii]|uniref:NAC domain-containing protein n=1 Tax=Salix dunnii TaxID=1413687 RepID=A0A835KFZ1_9ROSI|nr:hypothetical protein SADUNF_Sadunf04G0130100 [Salix dunnii]
MDEMPLQLDLPGFRFHPTEEELLDFYLKNMVFSRKMRLDVIGYLNIYRHDPSELPGLSKDIVLCKIYRKATSLKVLEQRATMEEEMRAIHASPSSSSLETMSFCSQLEEPVLPPVLSSQHLVFKREIEDDKIIRYEQPKEIKGSSLQLPMGEGKLPELQVPSKRSMEWNQDPIWSLNSPWLQNVIPYADVLNF